MLLLLQAIASALRHIALQRLQVQQISWQFPKLQLRLQTLRCSLGLMQQHPYNHAIVNTPNPINPAITQAI
jgi:hypothetical protein